MATDSVESALSTCLSRYLIPAVPGRTLERVIQVTLDRSLYAADIAPVVMENGLYSQFVLKVDFLQGRIKEWIAEAPEGHANIRLLLERVFLLLGKQASRNLVASIRVARLSNTLPKKKTERFAVNPKEQLKYGLAAEGFCENRNYAESHIAFLAGLQYDLLQTAFLKAKAPREAMNAIQTHFSESLKIAHFAYEIGSRMGSFPFSEYAFSSALSLGLGKILAYSVYPKDGGSRSYAGFLSEVEKKTVLKWMFAEHEESRRFPVHPAELSGIAVTNFGFFKQVEPAIRFYREAYHLKATHPKLPPLALLLSLAESSALGRSPAAGELAQLRDLQVNPNILTMAAKIVNAPKGRE